MNIVGIFGKCSGWLASITGEPFIPSLSRGCPIIFLKEGLGLDQCEWLQLPRESLENLSLRRVLQQKSSRALEDSAAIQVVDIPYLGM